jgi:glycosyltransferase involved in cell wall biosynthesis
LLGQFRLRLRDARSPVAGRISAADEPAPVSVIIPAFNRADTLPRALRSVFAQGLRPAEVIVVDDHSDDVTARRAEELGARVIRHERNQGAAAARNTAVAAATQPWLATLDSDDEWLPHHLATLWSLRSDHVLVAGASVSWFDDAPETLPMYAGTARPRTHTLRSPAALIPQNPIPASAVLVRREAVLAAGGYNTELKYAEDWDLWLRVLEHGTAVITPRVVCVYHRHAGQKSGHDVGPSETHNRIVCACVERPWWSAKLGQRWNGLRLWDEIEFAAAQGRTRQAGLLTVRLLAHPQRVVAVALRRYRFWMSVRRSERLRRTDLPARVTDRSLVSME